MTDVPGDNMQTTDTTGEFGKSDFGQRLNYEPQSAGCCADWRDKGWAIFYYLHVLAMCILAVVLPLTQPTITWVTPSPLPSGIPYVTNTINPTGICVTLLIQCVIGAVFGLIWLKVMQKFAEQIIKRMLFLVMILWIAVAVVGVIIGAENGGTGLIAAGIIMFLIQALYTWCIWSRIPFSSALLSIASSITQTFEGTICISLLMIPFNIIWYFIWTFSFYGFLLNEVILADPYEQQSGVLYFYYFLLMLSLYWGLQVNKNISHTTTCGVSATWYYSKEVHKPTMPALKRTLTTSFGSVCFGSFIVAILQATRAVLRSQRRNTILACIIYCLLLCIERLIRYFNMYAFAQVAIYGTDFIQSAKATWGLFASKGFEMIINDDLTGLALFCGGVLAFVVCFFAGWFIIPLWYPTTWDITVAYYVYYDEILVLILKILVSIVGGGLGYYLCVTILMVVRSSIVCLFVCFAEDPAALQENRPEQFNQLTGAKQELQTYAQTGHTGLGQEQQGQDGGAQQ